MRKYAPLKIHDIWSIIYNDDYETEWYTEIENVGTSRETAIKVSDALNRANEPRDSW